MDMSKEQGEQAASEGARSQCPSEKAATPCSTAGEEPTTPRVAASEVFKKFVDYYKPYKFLFFFDLVCAVVLACIDLAFPQFLNFFTKDFFLRPAPEVLGALGWILAAFAALYLVRTGCQFFITSWGHVMGAYMEADMRADLFAQYQRLSFSYYDRHNTGVMMSKLLTDLFDISELAHHGPEKPVHLHAEDRRLVRAALVCQPAARAGPGGRHGVHGRVRDVAQLHPSHHFPREPRAHGGHQRACAGLPSAASAW